MNVTLSEFLFYLQSNGVNAAVGFLLSFIMDWFPGFNDLDAKAKRFAMLGLCLAVPLLAALLATVGLKSQPFVLETFWQAAMAGFLAFVASQAAHTRKL